MDKEFVIKRYGEHLDLGTCLVGANLNLLTVRGYARLDQLACISAPDVYDMVDNKTGTQRELNEKHAQECLEYALGATIGLVEEDPRFFPEILLSVRDKNVIELYDLEDPNEVYDLDSLSGQEDIEDNTVGLSINLGALEFPKREKGPQISRVDGNHRLRGADELLETAANANEEPPLDDFPYVPFSLLIALEPIQEAKLFRDINGEHQGMEVAHLTTLTYRIGDPETLKKDPRHRSLWIAMQLTEKGRAFEDMVFMGGSKTGIRKVGQMPPIKINSLKSTIQHQIRSAPTVTVALEDDPDSLLTIIDNFWKAVAETFPEAWGNKRDFILLQAIGLGAFAKFGGSLMERAFDEEALEKEDFEKYLTPVEKEVSLRRVDYPGIAGAGGLQVIAELLIKAAGPEAVKTARIKAKLSEKKTIDDQLGLASSDDQTEK